MTVSLFVLWSVCSDLGAWRSLVRYAKRGTGPLSNLGACSTTKTVAAETVHESELPPI